MYKRLANVLGKTYTNQCYLSTTFIQHKNVIETVKDNKDNYYKHLNENQETEANPLDWDAAKPFEDMPGPKPIPILGNLFRFLPVIGEYHNVDLLELHVRLRKEYGDIFVLRGLPGKNPMVMAYDPNDMEMMFRNEGVWPIRLGLQSFTYYRSVMRNDIFQNVGGVLTVHGEDWFKFRSTVNPILMQPRVVQQYIQPVDAIATDFIEILKDLANSSPNGVMPDTFINELHKWSLESIGNIALDTRLGCLEKNLKPDSESQILISSVLEMFELMYRLDVLPSMWKFVNTPDWNKYVKSMDRITGIVLKYVDTAIKKLEMETTLRPEHERSALQRLLEKDRRIAITMVTDMLVAGIDTTSKTLAAALFFLSKNVDAQFKLREEMIRLLPSKDSKITKEVLAGASYLKAAIKETQRLAPIGVGNLRTSQKNMVLGGYKIPKGTDVLTGNLIIAMEDTYFKNGKNFIPERWMRNHTDDTISHKNVHPFVSLPFGFGPRSCVGKRLANLELEVILARIIRNFELNWPHKEDAKFGTSLLYGIISPISVQLKEVPT